MKGVAVLFLQVVFQFMNQYFIEILSILAIAFLLLLLIFLVMGIKLRSCKQKIKKLENLPMSIETLQEIDVEKIERKFKEIESRLASSLRNVGIVRYNAFEDVGSDLSFSIAVLDDNGNGFIMSTLYGRQESRTYIKPLKHGRSEYQLSEEELEAIKKGYKNDCSVME